MAKDQQQIDEADYVVVGAGSAGATVAAKLAQSGATVALIEAGPTDENFLVKKPGMIGPVHAEPKLKKTLDWGYYTVPQKHALDRKIPQTRGKVVGGSSSVNGMLWVRGNRANYDSWAAEGNTGWDADAVNRTYREMEDFEGGADEYRGAGGPIKVTRVSDPRRPVSDVFIDATAQALGTSVTEDYNGAEQEGASQFQQSVENGLRFSSSRGYLHSQELPSLTLQTDLHVTRVVIENGRAVGVEVQDAKGGRRVIRAGREVIVSAGVFGSPQLLMLSGIGHADHLGAHGIPVVSDLPVGDNLHDHLFVPTTWEAPGAMHKGTPFYFGKGLVQELRNPGKGWLSNTVFESVAFVPTSQSTGLPDLQIHLLPWAYPSPNQDAPVRHKVHLKPSLTVMPTLIYPKSRGTVRLASADPTAAPLIDFDYLAAPEDRRTLVEGVAMVREIMNSATMRPEITREVHPGPAYGPEQMETEVLNRATTVYHGVGSCRMGVDERAVVGPDLRVRGVEGLRVADASIMPSIIGGNTNAPSLMIGAKCAEFILG